MSQPLFDKEAIEALRGLAGDNASPEVKQALMLMKRLNAGASIGWRCPKCGSGYFGSSSLEPDRSTYYCHGEQCNFSCPDTDFWKHNQMNAVFRFKSKKEYEAFYFGRPLTCKDLNHE